MKGKETKKKTKKKKLDLSQVDNKTQCLYDLFQNGFHSDHFPAVEERPKVGGTDEMDGRKGAQNKLIDPCSNNGNLERIFFFLRDQPT